MLHIVASSKKRGTVQNNNRHKRIRQLIKKLNKERKKQAEKIDILCKDLIGAQRNFIKRLKIINFKANFYESIIGTTNLDNLLYTAVELIREEIPKANVIFFLRQTENYELYLYESEQVMALDKRFLENSFTPELTNNICMSNEICTLEDMFAMGLQGNPTNFGKISAITIPMGASEASLGFMFIYRSSENKISTYEISNISAIACGLSRAISSCQAILHSSD
jgi:hypothetical protein